jgi:hypothetical protein
MVRLIFTIVILVAVLLAIGYALNVVIGAYH